MHWNNGRFHGPVTVENNLYITDHKYNALSYNDNITFGDNIIDTEVNGKNILLKRNNNNYIYLSNTVNTNDDQNKIYIVNNGTLYDNQGEDKDKNQFIYLMYDNKDYTKNTMSFFSKNIWIDNYHSHIALSYINKGEIANDIEIYTTAVADGTNNINLNSSGNINLDSSSNGNINIYASKSGYVSIQKPDTKAADNAKYKHQYLRLNDDGSSSLRGNYVALRKDDDNEITIGDNIDLKSSGNIKLQADSSKLISLYKNDNNYIDLTTADNIGIRGGAISIARNNTNLINIESSGTVLLKRNNNTKLELNGTDDTFNTSGDVTANATNGRIKLTCDGTISFERATDTYIHLNSNKTIGIKSNASTTISAGTTIGIYPTNGLIYNSKIYGTSLPTSDADKIEGRIFFKVIN